jgi:hypothetical protein
MLWGAPRGTAPDRHYLSSCTAPTHPTSIYMRTLLKPCPYEILWVDFPLHGTAHNTPSNLGSKVNPSPIFCCGNRFVNKYRLISKRMVEMWNKRYMPYVYRLNIFCNYKSYCHRMIVTYHDVLSISPHTSCWGWHPAETGPPFSRTQSKNRRDNIVIYFASSINTQLQFLYIL